MTAKTRWVRAATARRKNAEKQAAVTAATRRVRLRRRVVHAVEALACFGLFLALGITSSHSHSPGTIVLSLVTALLVIVGFLAWGRLRPLLGGLTALLAVALVSGGLSLAASAASPQCPGSHAVGRCTTGELANWAMNGIFIPVIVGMFIGVPLITWRSGFRVTVALITLYRRVSDRVLPTPAAPTAPAVRRSSRTPKKQRDTPPPPDAAS